MSATKNAAPTSRQLGYLRALAGKSATTFVTPVTRRQASLEIDRLRALDAVPRASRFQEPEPEPEQLRYATAVQTEEVSGFGASATWRASAPAPPRAAPPQSRSVRSTELANYRVSLGERVLCGERIGARVRITDRPRSGAGPTYLVEREFECDDHSALIAVLADYIQRARDLDEVPMDSAVVRQMLSPVPEGA